MRAAALVESAALEGVELEEEIATNVAPSGLVESAALEGVELRLVDGELRVRGERAAKERWLPAIRERKAELVALLSAVPAAPESETPLSAAEARALSAWLDGMGEDDSAIRSHLLEQCRRDPEAKRYFLAKAAPVVRLRLTLESQDGARTEALLEVPSERYDGERVLELFERHRMAGSTRVIAVRQESPDDRRFCRNCARLRGGVCTAASQIGAQPGYRPLDDVPRRCEAFSERED